MCCSRQKAALSTGRCSLPTQGHHEAVKFTSDLLAKKPSGWKKNLYEKQPFADRYTDVTFLEELRKNVHFEEVGLLPAIRGAIHVSQQVATVVAFVMVFVQLDSGRWKPTTVLLGNAGIALLGYGWRYRKNKDFCHLRSHLKTAGIFLTFGFTSAPVLQTLTKSMATDTVHVLAILSFALHLLTFNYGVRAAVVSSALTLNSAIFASTCLASRLPSPLYAFALLTFAVEAFVLLPLLHVKVGFISGGICICTIGTWIWAVFGLWAAALFVGVVLILNCVFPYWFYKWQKHKENIYGPWDEAVTYSITPS